MRRLILLCLPLLAAPASAQPAQSSPWQSHPAPWNPAADYIVAGQDEPGYRRWYGEASYRPLFVATFDRYLRREGVAGIVPTWQLLRTASDWQRCGGQPFDVPPLGLWGNIVETLRYVRFHVIEAIGPVEAVSVYRGPALNACANGAPESTHLQFNAVDLVPLRPTDRETLIRTLCAAHYASGEHLPIGLGFYRGLRFHVDSLRFRNWGGDGNGGAACGPAARALDPLAPGKPCPPRLHPRRNDPRRPADSSGAAGRHGDCTALIKRVSRSDPPCVAQMQHHISGETCGA